MQSKGTTTTEAITPHQVCPTRCVAPPNQACCAVVQIQGARLPLATTLVVKHIPLAGIGAVHTLTVVPGIGTETETEAES